MNAKETERMKEETTNHEKYFDLRRVTSNTPAQISRIPPLILNVLAKMKNKGKSEYSIRFVDKSLTHISEHANLNNPQEAMAFIANKDVSNGYKKNLCLAYNKFMNYNFLKIGQYILTQ